MRRPPNPHNPHFGSQAERQAAFLEALVETGTYTASAKAAGVDRGTAWRWQKDSDFAAKCDEALALAAFALKDEAYRRGVLGVDVPVINRGQPTYYYALDASGYPIKDEHNRPVLKLDKDGFPLMLTIKQHSDQLLILLLKSRFPEFRDNSKLELQGSLSVNSMSDDEIRAELATLAATLAATGVAVPTPNDADEFI